MGLMKPPQPLLLIRPPVTRRACLLRQGYGGREGYG